MAKDPTDTIAHMLHTAHVAESLRSAAADTPMINGWMLYSIALVKRTATHVPALPESGRKFLERTIEKNLASLMNEAAEMAEADARKAAEDARPVLSRLLAASYAGEVDTPAAPRT